MLPQNLGAAEVRVLGSLIEKELSTPDHYPLSLNALTAACNQLSNRDPVMTLDEDAVSRAIDTLRRLSLVRSFQASGSRVPKYQHLLAENEGLSRPEVAALCVLALRGPQTLAEVRTRGARLLPGDDHDAAQAGLEALATREPAPVKLLPRRPGQKEPRYAHLLAGHDVQEPDDAPAPVLPASPDRIAALESQVRELQNEMGDLRAQLAEFRKQFE